MPRAPERLEGLMVKEVVALAPARSVGEAVRAMVDHGIGSVVVIRGEEPVGVFTERDFLRRIVDVPDLLGRSLEAVMTAPVVTLAPEAEVFDAFEVMTAKGIRRLPVVQDGRLVGMVTERDLLRWVRDVGNE
jgi:CBS domain-containing protein